MKNKNLIREIQKYLIIAGFTVILYVGLEHIDSQIEFIKKALGVLNPIILGFSIAFILNILVNKIEKKVFDRYFKENKFIYKKRKSISITISVILLLSSIIGIISVLIPQLIFTIKGLNENLPEYSSKVGQILNDMISSFNISSNTLTELLQSWNDFILKTTKSFTDLFLNSAPQLVNLISNIASSFLTFLLGFLLSIYMLMHKENIIRNIKRIMCISISDPTKYEYILHVFRTVNKSFNSFIAGQITESIILAILTYIGMTIFAFPYPLLIASIFGITCLIPYFGAFIGTIPSFFIIFITNPTKGLWFLVFAMCLQQLEGNIIYPKVVGNSVGLPTLWVSISIIVGGNTMGFIGMILGIPIFASVYFLYREYVYKKEERLKSEGKYYLDNIENKEDI